MNSTPDSSQGLLEQFLILEGLQTFKCHRRRVKFRKRILDRIAQSDSPEQTARAVVLAFINLVKNNTISCELDKQMQLELLRSAAHIAEKHKIGDAGCLHTIAQMHFKLAENFWDWFEFMSPFGESKKVKENSLYPFPAHSVANATNWLTHRHLKALDYYLACTWRMIIFARINRSFANTVEHQQPYIISDTFVPVNLVNCPINDKLFGTITPMTLACLSGNPEAVLLLLRHGAASLHPYNHIQCPQHDWSQPLYALINQLNAHPPPHKNSPDYEGDDHGRTRGQNLLTCLLYISRTMTVVPVKMVSKIGVNHVCVPQVLELLTDFKAQLPDHCTGGVARLQHLCRCMIRHCIQMHHHLPSHINHLPLPKAIKNYLDLGTDL